MMTRLRASLLRSLPLLLLAGCTLLLLSLIASQPLAWRLDVGAAGDSRFIRDLFPTEYDDATSFRWSTPTTRLRLHGAGDGTAVLRLRLHGDSRVAEQRLGVRLEQHQQPLAAFALAGGWRRYEVLLPPGTATPPPVATGCTGMACLFPRAQPIALVTTTYQPATGDDRELGVPLDWLEVEPLTGSSPAAALSFALLLTWGLALLAAVLWHLDVLFSTVPPAAPDEQHVPDFGRVLRVCLLCGLAALGGVVWAAHSLQTLAWLLQPLPPLLLAATLLLAGVTVAGVRWRVAGVRWRVAGVRWWGAAVLLLAHLLLLPPLPVAVRGVAAHVVLALPGVLLALWLFGSERDTPERHAPGVIVLFLALCGSLVVAPLLLLALHTLPGALQWWLLLLLCDVISLAVIAQNVKRKKGKQPQRHAEQEEAHGEIFTLSSPTTPRAPFFTLPFAFFIFTGAVLRLLFLGSAEFQGDEANVILMATGVLHGHDDVLLLHRKGPLEVLLVAGPLVLTHHINELVARLPFAVAGIGVLLGVYLLAQRIAAHSPPTHAVSRFTLHVSFTTLAVAIVALDGFLIAFSRIVQYQSVVLVLSMGALWCCWRFYEGEEAYGRYLLAAAAMVAVGLLAHYDTIFITPALALLVLLGGRRRGWRVQQWLRAVAAPLLLAAGVLAAFFVPFVTHERFARTTDYLTQRMAESEQSSIFFNNLGRYYALATYYNTTYQMIALGVALLLALLVWLCISVRPRWLGVLLAVLLLSGAVLLVLAPQRFLLPLHPLGSERHLNWAVVAAGVPLAALITARATPMPLRVLLLWFTPPFLTMSFLIARPNTHFYAMSCAAALLIAWAVMQLIGWLRRQQRRWLAPLLLAPLLLGGVVLVLLTLPYLSIVYVRQVPEYRRTFPDARPGIYLAGYGDTLPEDGSYFGFTHRDGWKVIGELYRRGVLQGDYDSNQKSLVTGWYTRGAFRCGHDPDYYFAARFEPYRFVPETYHLAGAVTVDGIRTLDIYSRERPQEPLPVFALRDYAPAFDAVAVGNFPMQRALAETLPQYRTQAVWQGGVRLRGYDLDRRTLQAGQKAVLLLSWQVDGDATVAEQVTRQLQGYEVAVVLTGAQGEVVRSGVAFCDVRAPETWRSGEAIQSAFLLTNSAAIPPGTYSIQVGLWHAGEQHWFPIERSSENWVEVTQVAFE